MPVLARWSSGRLPMREMPEIEASAELSMRMAVLSASGEALVSRGSWRALQRMMVWPMPAPVRLTPGASSVLSVSGYSPAAMRMVWAPAGSGLGGGGEGAEGGLLGEAVVGIVAVRGNEAVFGVGEAGEGDGQCECADDGSHR